MKLEYKVGQDIYTLIKNGNIVQTHKTYVHQIIIDTNGITYKIADNFPFGGLLGKCYRENGRIFKFKTQKQANEFAKKINEGNKKIWKN